MICRLVHAAVTALALATLSALPAPAWADIVLHVGAAGHEAQGAFGAGVTRVHGRATDAGAFVDTGPSPCLGPMNCMAANLNAATNADFDASTGRWRVAGHAVGNNTGTAVQLLVTDVISLVGTPNGFAQLNFKVRVEIDELFANPSSDGVGADVWYAYELGALVTNEGPPSFQPFFSLLAEEHHYDGYPSQTVFTAPGVSDTVVPSVYEHTFSMPVFLGASGQGFFELAIRSNADTAVQGGVAGVRSFNSAYLGLTATGASLGSASGYGYLGFRGNNQTVPEPASAWLAAAAGALLLGQRATRRRPAR